MKRFLVLCLLISSPTFADEGLSPQQAVENYFEFFNNEDRASLNASSGTPFVFVIGGKPTAYFWKNLHDCMIPTFNLKLDWI